LGGKRMNQLTFELSSGKYYYHYPFPVAIIGVKVDEKVNFMSAAWHTQLSFDPPLYGILISPKRYTSELIKQTDAFSVNFLKFEDYKIAGFVGRTSGKDLDKVKTFELKYFDGKVLPVPVLENAIACYECKIVDQRTYGDHILYVGEIVGIHYDKTYYDNGLSKSLLLYHGNDRYTYALNKSIRFGKEEVYNELSNKKV
jgi:flavin reductase (DIM6/NTAB) family NADH-FMN oxidoreductase RutF